MNKKEREAYLSETHARFVDYNQGERQDSRFMADHGHPFAADYETLRAEFDRLRYACNSSERFVAFKDRDQFAECRSPELEVSWHPTGIDGFYSLYPAHEKWMDYLAAAAAAGWPEGVEPRLKPGSLRVHTPDAKLVGALYAACNGHCQLDRESGTIKFEAYPKTASEMLACLAVVRRKMRRWVPPDRTEADAAGDASALPLAKKAFRVGNVRWVTVTDRSVLVPLVRLGDASSAASIATDLVNLCRQGFPYEPVRQWLAGSSGGVPKFVDRATLRRLDKEFEFRPPNVA